MLPKAKVHESRCCNTCPLPPVKNFSRSPHCAKSVYDAWLASRVMLDGEGAYLAPGSQRPFNTLTFLSAYTIAKTCMLDLVAVLWSLQPSRSALMILLNLLRSLFPAFRGYSQALVINEIQSLITSGHFPWSRLTRLVATEILRRIVESLLDSFAINNESLVHESARLFVEYHQLRHRLRLDVPTLEDPVVRDLLQESDTFARSFSAMGGFGLLSPFDFINILNLSSELASHLFVLLSLTRGAHLGILLLSILSVLFPLFMRHFGMGQSYSEASYSPQDVRMAERMEKLRCLAVSDEHRPEIILFGLGPWILKSWVDARKTLLVSDNRISDSRLSQSLLSQINFSDILFALQNIPLVLLLKSTTSLGSLALYRSSIQSCMFTIQSLVTTVRMTYQGVFLMGAFYAAFEIQPRLQPRAGKTLGYQPSARGATLEVRNLTYTYPGSRTPCLQNVSFQLQAGESLAIVGYNGSGKSTLAKILLRILEFDEGELKINGVDIRSLDIADYHRRVTTVFQGFSKFNATLKENVGVGYVERLGSSRAVEQSIRLAGGQSILESLPRGLRTKLMATSHDFPPSLESHGNPTATQIYHGLSGGEWQRIAISRAFMRAGQPEVELLLFDEPTSSLDAHAQNTVFETINQLSRSAQGERRKTVVFITHRLSTARRADKIAMMEHGTITEFGSHNQLLEQNCSYAALYRASI